MKKLGFIYISKNSYELRYIDSSGDFKTFISETPKRFIKDLEITEKQNYIKSIATELAVYELKGYTFVMLLADDFIFSKSFPKSQFQQNKKIKFDDLSNQMVSEFLTEVPMDGNLVTSVVLVNKETYTVVSYNIELISVFLSVFDDLGIKCEFAFSKETFPIVNSVEDVKALSKKLKRFSKQNLIISKGSSSSELPKDILMFLGAFFGFIAFGILYFLFKDYLTNFTSETNSKSMMVQNTESFTEPVLEVEEIDNSKVALIVYYNPSNIDETLLSKINSELTGRKFQNVELFVSTDDFFGVKLSYQKYIPQSVLDDLSSFFESEFGTVEFAETTEVIEPNDSIESQSTENANQIKVFLGKPLTQVP